MKQPTDVDRIIVKEVKLCYGIICKTEDQDESKSCWMKRLGQWIVNCAFSAE